MKKLLLFTLFFTLFMSCGVEETSDPSIVGGQRAYRSFVGTMEVGGGFRCGSTLISKRFALTAKHCLPNPKNYRRIKLRFGAYNVNRADNEGKPFDLVPVKRVIAHPSHDLALLELQRPAKFNPKRYTSKRPPDGAKVYAFGMGNKAWGVSGGGIMRGVVLQHVVKKKGAKDKLYVGRGKGYDVCHGDSGGPLMYKGVLVGVATFTASECGNYDSLRRPSGFTRPDMQWIARYVKGA